MKIWRIQWECLIVADMEAGDEIIFQACNVGSEPAVKHAGCDMDTSGARLVGPLSFCPLMASWPYAVNRDCSYDDSEMEG